MTIVIYLLVGGFAGLLAGLFGGGGGLILIPALIMLLHAKGFQQSIIAHTAIGTSFAILTATIAVSSYKHWRHGHINWTIVKRFFIPLTVSVIFGAVFSSSLPSHILIKVFGVVVLITAVFLMFYKLKEQPSKPVSRLSTISAGSFVGALCGALCINPFTVPYLCSVGYSIRTAISTSIVIGSILSIYGTILFIILGWNTPGLPPYSTGFVYWPVFPAFAIASIITVPLGIRINQRLSATGLKVAYCILLLVIGVKMAI